MECWGCSDCGNSSPQDKVVVQLFKGNEGQQDSEVTMALPSSTPSPSKARVGGAAGVPGSRPDPWVEGGPWGWVPLQAPRSVCVPQRAALLLQQLLQMVKDRPDAVAVLMELWGLTAEWGVDPIPQDLLDTHSLSS